MHLFTKNRCSTVYNIDARICSLLQKRLFSDEPDSGKIVPQKSVLFVCFSPDHQTFLAVYLSISVPFYIRISIYAYICFNIRTLNIWTALIYGYASMYGHASISRHSIYGLLDSSNRVQLYHTFYHLFKFRHDTGCI